MSMNPVTGMKLHGAGITTLASAATQILPQETVGPFEISGSATITSLTIAGDVVQGGRFVWFYGATSAAVVFTNTNDATAAGTMDLGGSNITLGQQDVLVLMQKTDGTWIRWFTTNN